jgi:hypothetical protein
MFLKYFIHFMLNNLPLKTSYEFINYIFKKGNMFCKHEESLIFCTDLHFLLAVCNIMSRR